MGITSSEDGTLPVETSSGSNAHDRESRDSRSDVYDRRGLSVFVDHFAEKQTPLGANNEPIWLQQEGDDSFEQVRITNSFTESSNTLCHASIPKEDGITPPPSVLPKAASVGWSDLPKKRQLAILTLARLSEPLTQTSLQAYMFYQLRSFDPSLPDATISFQAGILQGSFTAAQFLTAMLWGRAADSEKCGRKWVLLIGLSGTCMSCVGFGFSRSFIQAAVFRTLGGALNGNVGVMRTMISEIIKEKKFQSRAFLLLPMCFNIGVIIGPILGGLLSDPVSSYPKIFGSHSVLGGEKGVWWLRHWPYALPNLLSAFFLLMSAAAVMFGLEEVNQPY